MLVFILLHYVSVLPNVEQQVSISQKVTITPRLIDRQAFRYMLLPPLKDQKTGNAVQHYYRCFSPDALNWMNREPFQQRLYLWLDQPYQEAAKLGQPPQIIPKAEYDDPVPATRSELSVLSQNLFFDEIDKAARHTHAEWEYLERIKENGMLLMLPDVGGVGFLSTLVQTRARLALMDGNHERALHHLQTGIAIGQHLGQANMLATSLTGMGITRNMLKVIAEFIQTPQAPNLYWALTDLPRPLFDFRLAYAGDRIAIEHMMGDPQVLEERVFTQAEMQTFIEKKLKPFLRMTQVTEREMTVMVLKEYPTAKAWLKETQHTDQDIEQMTATQAVLLHARARYRLMADEFAKIFSLPLSERMAATQAMSTQLKALHDSMDMSFKLGFMFNQYYPNVFITAADSDREVVRLRCIELLRHYAAGHGNRLPASWDDVKDLPIPTDPITGKRLRYELQGDHAMIELEAIPNAPLPRPLVRVAIYVK